jgi:(+)-pinoresinol hydroxylase
MFNSPSAADCMTELYCVPLLYGADWASANEKGVDRGKVVFDKWCTACHAAGPGHPGTGGLAVKYGAAEPAELERRTDLTTDIVKYYVWHGFSVVAPFRKTEISGAELNDLASYLTAAKGQ